MICLARRTENTLRILLKSPYGWQMYYRYLIGLNDLNESKNFHDTDHVLQYHILSSSQYMNIRRWDHTKRGFLHKDRKFCCRHEQILHIYHLELGKNQVPDKDERLLSAHSDHYCFKYAVNSTGR